VKVAIHVNDGIAIDRITYKIPEVRAGPCKGEYLI
jgi:hypothetical protein